MDLEGCSDDPCKVELDEPRNVFAKNNRSAILCDYCNFSCATMRAKNSNCSQVKEPYTP